MTGKASTSVYCSGAAAVHPARAITPRDKYSKYLYLYCIDSIFKRF